MRCGAVPFEDDSTEFGAGEGCRWIRKNPKAPPPPPAKRAVVDASEAGGPDVPGVGPGGRVGDGVMEGGVALGDIGESAIDGEDEVPEGPPCPRRCADGSGADPGVVVNALGETGVQVMPEAEDTRPVGFGKASTRTSIGRYPGWRGDDGAKPPGNGSGLGWGQEGGQDAGFGTMEPVPMGRDLDCGKVGRHQTLTQAWR